MINENSPIGEGSSQDQYNSMFSSSLGGTIDLFSELKPGTIDLFSEPQSQTQDLFFGNGAEVFNNIHNSNYNNFIGDQSSAFNTELDPYNELQFGSWKSNYEQKFDTRLNESDYDWRGYYKDLQGNLPDSMEAPSKFTKPSHMFFSNDSIYNGTNGFVGGVWEGNTFIQGTDRFYDSSELSDYLSNQYGEEKFSVKGALPEEDLSKWVYSEQDSVPILSRMEAEKIAKQRGAKTIGEHFNDFIDPDESNDFLKSVAIIGGGGVGSLAGGVIGGFLGGFAGAMVGRYVGGIIGGYFGGKIGTEQSGDYKRRQAVLEASTRLNAGDYSSQEERINLQNTITQWANESQIESYRKDSSWASSVVDSVLDVAVYGAEFAAPSRAISSTFRFAGNRAVALTRGQMGLAKSLNPKGAKDWLKLSEEMAEAQRKGIKFKPRDKEIAAVLFNGPLKITPKQSKFILKQVDGLDDAARAAALPKLIQQQIFRNQSNWINNGDKVISGLRRLRNPALAALQVGGTQVVRQSSIQDEAMDEYIKSMDYKDGKFVFDESILSPDAELKRQIRATNQILIERFTDPVIGVLGRSPAYRKAIKPITDAVIKNPATKIAGATGVTKALNKLKDSPLGKNFDRGSRFQKLLYDASIEDFGTELFEEYLEIVSEATFDFDKDARKEAGISYLDNVANAFMFPVKNPREASIIAATVGVLPVGAAALGTLTGSKTQAERKRLNRLILQLKEAEGTAITEERALQIFKDVYGEGTQAYNNATSRRSIINRLFNPLGTDVSKIVFGKSFKQFSENVDTRAQALAGAGNKVNQSHKEQAVSELVSESIIFNAVVKDQETADYLKILERNEEIHNIGNKDQVFLDILETTVEGKQYTFIQRKKVIEEKTLESVKERARAKAALDAKSIEITPEGRVVDPSTRKFISKAEIESRGMQAEKQGITDIITKTGELTDRFAVTSSDAATAKKLKNKSKLINTSLFKTLNSARAEGNGQLEKETLAQIKSDIKDKLNITVTGQIGTSSIGKRYLKSVTQLSEIDLKINDFIERSAAALDKNPNLSFRAISDSIFLDQAAESTGRKTKGAVVEAFNEGNNIYVSGLSFAADPKRVMDEEVREVDVKSKFGGKAVLTTLSSDAISSTISFLEQEAESTDDLEKKNQIIKGLSILSGQNKFESFIQFSQALSGQGKKELANVVQYLSPEVKQQLNTAVYAEYTDQLLPSVTEYMSPSEAQIARDEYGQWEQEGGRRAIDAFTKIEIPEAFLTQEARQRLEENQVKLYDPKAQVSRSYFLGEEGWVNNNGKLITNTKLTDKLDQRLAERQRPMAQQRSKKNLRKVEARINFYRKIIPDYIDVADALESRLNNSKLNLSQDQVAATELVLSEIDQTVSEMGSLSSSMSLHDLSPDNLGQSQSKLKRLVSEEPLADISFSSKSLDSYGEESKDGKTIQQVDEDADPETSFETDFFASTGKGTIASFIQSKYGRRNGSLIIWGIRKSEQLEKIATDDAEFERFVSDPGTEDSYHMRMLRKSVNNDYIDPESGEKRQITREDVYEFWRVSQSYNLVPFVTVLKTNVKNQKGEKEVVFSLATSNENNLFKIAQRNAIVNLESDKIDSLVEQYVNGEDYFDLLENIIGIDREILIKYNELNKGKLIQILSRTKPESKTQAAHLKSLIGVDKLTNKGGTILQSIAPLLKSETQFKTRFRNRRRREQSAIIGDSHFIDSINNFIDRTISDDLSLTERQKALAFLDSENINSIDDPELQYKFEQKNVFKLSLKEFGNRYYYQFLPAFAEKEKVAMVAQRYFGPKKSDLLKAAKETSKFIKENIATEDGRLMYPDPYKTISKMKSDIKGNFDYEQTMAAHQLIHMPVIMDAIVGDVSAYVKANASEVGVETARYMNTINLIARHSQVSTDGIRHRGPINVIQVPEITLDDYEGADGLDGQMMFMEELMDKLLDDFGANTHRGSSSEDMKRGSDGKYELDYIKGHISASIQNESKSDIKQSRILIKTNMWNPTIMQETTRQPDGKSQLDDIIRLVRAYNADKSYEDQIHGVAFPSGAKLFPGEETAVEEDFKPNIIRLGPESSIIKTTNLRHGINAISKNKMFKQQHAQMGVLNQDVLITTPTGQEILYSGNGLKAARLRLEVTRERLNNLDLLSNLEDLVTDTSPAYIREAVDRGESLLDPRYESWLFEQLGIKVKSTSIPNINRVALQVMGGLSGTPPTYGKLQPGGYFKTARVKANVKFARYNTYVDENGKPFKTQQAAVEYISRNKRFFYDMYFVNSDGYPGNEVMVHELDQDADGNYVIPGEYTIQTRIPSGSLASHSFGRLTEPASESFENINIIVTNEGIRIAKGEDQDGDKSYVHLMSRRIDRSVQNGMFNIVDGTLSMVNPDGQYNLIHAYDNIKEDSSKRKESIESKLNRAMALEFAIWHTAYARAGYDVIGDIPKSAFDAEIVEERASDPKQIGNINIATPNGLARIHGIFKNRGVSTGIFAKINSTYSWLAAVQEPETLSDDLADPTSAFESLAINTKPQKNIQFDLEIPSELSFENMFSVKRALEILLNRSIDDNKEAKLFLMNLNQDTDGIAAFLLMTNIKSNDLPRNNNNFAEKSEDGEYKYQAYKDILKVLKFINSDFVRRALPTIKDAKGHEQLFEIIDFWDQKNTLGGENAGSFLFQLMEIAKSMRSVSDIMDVAFESPKDITDLDSLNSLFDDFNEETLIFLEEELNSASVIQMAKENNLKFNEIRESLPSLSLSSKVVDRYGKEKLKLEQRVYKNEIEVINENINKVFILKALKELSGNSDQSLSAFIKEQESIAFSIFDKSNSEYANDRKLSIIKNYLGVNTPSRGIRKDKKIISLNDLFKQIELTPEIINNIEGSFEKLSLKARVALATYMVTEYGLETTNFTGSIFGMIGNLSLKINTQVKKVSEEMINSGVNPAINDMSLVLQRDVKNKKLAKRITTLFKPYLRSQPSSTVEKLTVPEYRPPQKKTKAKDKEAVKPEEQAPKKEPKPKIAPETPKEIGTERETITFDMLPDPVANTKNMVYTGIGSRQTPKSVQKRMKAFAKRLKQLGYTLRTGDAAGADEAFSKGDPEGLIFTRKDANETTRRIAKEIHPAGKNLKSYSLDFHARNTNQVFGSTLESASDFLLVWTPEGWEGQQGEWFDVKGSARKARPKESGGTFQAIDMAGRKGIPVFNFANKDAEARFAEFIKKEEGKERQDDVTFSVSDVTLEEVDSSTLKINTDFQWEPRLLAHKKRHLFDKGTWSIEKMLQEAGVPKVFVRGFEEFAADEVTLEDKVAKVKSLFTDNLSINLLESDKFEGTSFNEKLYIDNAEDYYNNGEKLPYRDMNAFLIGESNYRILTIRANNLNETNNDFSHFALMDKDMIGWFRVNVNKNKLELVEYQSDLFQRWQAMSKEPNFNYLSKENRFVFDVLADKNNWVKFGSDIISSLLDITGRDIVMPSRSGIMAIQQYPPSFLNKKTKVFSHYEKLSKLLAEKRNGFLYSDNLGQSIKIYSKQLSDKTWTDDLYVPETQQASSFKNESLNVTDRNKILSEVVLENYKDDYILNNKGLEKLLPADADPRINWDAIIKEEQNNQREGFIRSNNKASEKTYTKNIEKINKKINSIIKKNPGILENGNARFLTHYKYLNDKVYKNIAEGNYDAALSQIKNPIIQSEIVEHMAIIDSINNNKNDKPNSIFLQTNRKEYGIQDTVESFKGMQKINEIILDDFQSVLEENVIEMSDPDNEFMGYDDRYFDITDDINSLMKEEKKENLLNEFKQMINNLQGSPYQQYKAIKLAEEKERNAEISPRLLSSFKKYVRLINGVPTKNEMKTNRFEKPYADVEITPITFSIATIDMVKTLSGEMSRSGETLDLRRNSMQQNLIDATRSGDVVVNNAITRVNNLLRITGGKSLYTKDKKGKFKIIYTNKKFKELGRDMRRTLTYLVEHYSEDSDAWKQVQLIDPEVFGSKQRDIRQDENNGKYFYIKDGHKTYFKTLGELVSEIENKRQELGAGHLLSFKESDLKNSIQQVRDIFESLHEDYTDMMQPLNEQFISHVENYIPHQEIDFDFSNIDTSKREVARAEIQRKYKTWFEMFDKAGILPAKTLDVAELAKVYANSNTKTLRNRLAVTTMATMADVDLMPLMLFDSVEELGLITESAANEIADQLVLGMRSVDKNFEFKDITYDNGYQRLSRLVSQIDPEKYGYKKIKSNYRNIKTVYVKEGSPHSIAKHVFYDDVRFESDFATKAFRVIEKINLLGKIQSVSLSLFHPFALYESYIAIMGVDAFKPKSYKKIRETYAELATNPDALSEWKAYGLKTEVGRAPDEAYSDYHGFVTKLGRYFLNKPLTKPVGASLIGLSNMKKFGDVLMWEVMLPMMKVESANRLYLETIEYLEQNNVQYDMKNIKSDIAQFVNDAFGNQEWEQYVEANPVRRRILNQIMFAPDWTLSALNVSGVSHVAFANRALGSPTSDLHQKFRTERYWPNFAGLVLFAIPNALQYAITSLAAASGNGDEDDEYWTFKNEKGLRTAIDITPFFRTIGIYDDLGSSKERRIYMRWGKQAYEVFEGWLTDPIDTVLGKSSIGIKILMEQTLGIVKPGWQVPWADHDFLESLVAVDGNVWDGRLAAVAQKFLPMSMSSLFEYASGKDPSLIKPPSFVVPTKFGTSESKARREIASIARIYAEANWSSKFKGVYPEKTLRANVNEVLDAAKKNGYNIKSIYDGGISQARTYYYSQFMKALEANDFDKMVESAEKLHTLNTSYKGLKASIKGKFKKEEGIYDIPNNKAARMYTAWSVADKNQRKKGKINPYSFN